MSDMVGCGSCSQFAAYFRGLVCLLEEYKVISALAFAVDRVTVDIQL